MSKIRVKQIEDIHTDEAYLKEDLKVTTKVGEVKSFDTGKNYATISATKSNGAKKTVQEVLEEIFSKDNDPTVSQPSLAISVSPNAQRVEVGTTVAVTVTPTFSPGSYSYGPATGVVAESIKAQLMLGGTKLEDIDVTGGAAAFGGQEVGDGQTLTVAAQADHSEGAIPYSQLGNPKASLTISAGSKTAASKTSVTGSRAAFYGTASAEPATSAAVRALATKNLALSSGSSFTLTPGNNDTCFAIAIPTAWGRGIKAVNTGTGYDETANFVKTTLNVEGYNGYAAAAYDLYVCRPAVISGLEYRITII